jgi:hypothetical protein
LLGLEWRGKARSRNFGDRIFNSQRGAKAPEAPQQAEGANTNNLGFCKAFFTSRTDRMWVQTFTIVLGFLGAICREFLVYATDDLIDTTCQQD